MVTVLVAMVTVLTMAETELATTALITITVVVLLVIVEMITTGLTTVATEPMATMMRTPTTAADPLTARDNKTVRVVLTTATEHPVQMITMDLVAADVMYRARAIHPEAMVTGLVSRKGSVNLIHKEAQTTGTLAGRSNKV